MALAVNVKESVVIDHYAIQELRKGLCNLASRIMEYSYDEVLLITFAQIAFCDGLLGIDFYEDTELRTLFNVANQQLGATWDFSDFEIIGV
ncbi:hypothetical protein ACFX4N_23430 [Priestia sp. YIM B13551]|uniref:hypothetical protein n=1 Tax=Priestia sp. YIM B13551 TaxID=3366306 RepID=UPI00366CF504